MPHPSASLATLRPDLGGSFEEFSLEMDRLGFIGLEVLPVIDVEDKIGTYGSIPIEELLRDTDTQRAPTGKYNQVDWQFETKTFACKENGLKVPVDDNNTVAQRNYFNAELISAGIARDRVLRNLEKRIAALVFNTTTFTGASLTTAAGTPWSTVASATPVADVEAAVRKVYANSGMWPNAIVMSRTTFRNCRLCADVVAKIHSSGAGCSIKSADITPQMLAEVFDLKRVIIAGSSKNTAKQGQAASLSSIWANTMAMVCRVAETSNIEEPCLGRTFHWAADGSSIGATMETYRDEDARADIVRARQDTDEKIIETNFGHLLTSVG